VLPSSGLAAPLAPVTDTDGGPVRALLVHNPNATSTSQAVVDVIAGALAASTKLDVEGTKRRDHAGFLAAGAVHEGYDVVFALGGDGTLNEVVQGLAGTPIRLGLIPGGSANVFARILGIPTDPVEATAAALRHLARGEDRHISLGRANGRWFTFCAGFGYDAEVVRRVEETGRMKRVAKQGTFLWCGLRAQLAGTTRSPEILVRPDGGEPVDDLRSLVVCNADPYTFLGPLPSRMCPEAKLEAGLDATALTRGRLVDIARLMRTALFTDGVPQLSFTRTWHDLAGLTATNGEPLAVHTDGEVCPPASHLRLELVPRALRVLA
jgi:diacylglycerol kinase family enzyme